MRDAVVEAGGETQRRGWWERLVKSTADGQAAGRGGGVIFGDFVDSAYT